MYYNISIKQINIINRTYVKIINNRDFHRSKIYSILFPMIFFNLIGIYINSNTIERVRIGDRVFIGSLLVDFN